MQILEGLKKYQAVRFNKGFIVSLVENRYEQPSEHIIKGVSISLKQTYLDDLECVKRVLVTPKEISHYVDNEGLVVSCEEVQRIRLLSAPYWDEYSDEYSYPSLEVEFDIKKKQLALTNLQTIYTESVTIYEDVDFAIIGVQEDTGSEFITTPYQIGKTTFDNKGGVYMIKSPLSVSFSEWVSLTEQHPHDKFENPSHSGLRYGKVNGGYIFGGTDKHLSHKKDFPRLFHSLNEAKLYETSIRDQVRLKVIPHLKKYQEVGETERKGIYKELERILQVLKQVECKQKSVSSKKGCIDSVQNLIIKLSEV